MRVLVLGEVAADAARVASGLEQRGLQARDGPLRMAAGAMPPADILVLCLARWSASAAAVVEEAERRGWPVVVAHGGAVMDHRFLFELGLEDAVGPPHDALDSLSARLQRARARQREMGRTRILICGYQYHHPLRTLRNTGARGPAESALRDHGPALQALTFYHGNHDSRARVLSQLSPGSAVLGWGDASEGEHVFVRAASEAGCYTIPADFAYNLSALAGALLRTKQQRSKVRPHPDKREPHTVTFVMTDGDNVQWILNDFATSHRWFGHPQRGRVPVGWTISPSLQRLASPVLRWLYEAACPGRDVLVAAPSGLGYAYPSHMPNVDRFASASVRAMGDADLDIVTIIDQGGFRPEILSEYLRHSSTQACEAQFTGSTNGTTSIGGAYCGVTGARPYPRDFCSGHQTSMIPDRWRIASTLCQRTPRSRTATA